MKYSACFVLCPVTAPGLAVPYAVSVISKIRSPAGNVLLVRNTDDDVDLANTTNFNLIPEKIGVCVKPLHFDYDSVSALHSAFVHYIICMHRGKHLIDTYFHCSFTGFVSTRVLRNEYAPRNFAFYIL